MNMRVLQIYKKIHRIQVKAKKLAFSSARVEMSQDFICLQVTGEFGCKNKKKKPNNKNADLQINLVYEHL